MTRRVHPPRSVPPVGAPRPLRFPDIQTLDDGPLRALLAPRRGLPILDLHVVFRHGAAADPPKLPGCASMTAASLDTGTDSSTQQQIAERVEALGTTLAVRTLSDHCSVGLRVLSDRVRPALDLLAELVRDAVFPAPELDLRKQLRVEALLQQHDEPQVMAGHAIARAIFGADHPYGRPHAGTSASINALDRDDVLAFHGHCIRVADAFVVAVGDTDEEALSEAIRNSFQGWAQPAADAIAAVPDPTPVTPRIGLIDRPGAPQSEVRLGAIGAERGSRDYFALLVFNTMLGGSFTSRLNTRLREERGYTYGAFSRFGFRRSRGPFVAGAAVDAGVTHLAIADFLDVFHTIRDEAAPEAEIERARQYLSLGLVHGLETNAGVAERIVELEIHGLGDRYYDGYVERIGEVTREQVREVAARYLDPGGLAIVVVGDGSGIRGGLEALGAGVVVEESVEV